MREGEEKSEGEEVSSEKEGEVEEVEGKGGSGEKEMKLGAGRLTSAGSPSLMTWNGDQDSQSNTEVSIPFLWFENHKTSLLLT